MINAIDIIFGAKAKKEIIKTGASKAFIELTLCDINQSTKSIFEENEIDYDSNEIIISKEVSETSSRSRVNGVLVTQDFIKLLREKLIDIHSQHQTYTYIQPKFHISLLDSFANDIHKNLLQEYKTTFKTYNETLKLYEKAKENCSQTQDKIEFLKFQIKEIEDAEITNLNEDTELEKELDILSNAQILKELTYSSYWQIYGNDGNIIDALNDIKVNITKATNYDDSLNSTQEALIDALENLKEVLDLQTSTTASACVIVSSNFDKIKPIIKEQKLRPLSLSKQTLKHSAFNTLLEKTFPTPKLPSNKLDQEQLALQRFAKDHQQTIQKLFSSPYVFDFPFSEQNTILKNANLCLKTKSNIYCSLDSELSFIQNLINAKNKLPKNSTIQKLILLTSFQPLNSTTLPKDSGLFFTFQSRNAILLPFEITSNPIQTIKQKAGINPAHTNNLMQFYQFKTVEIDIK